MEGYMEDSKGRLVPLEVVKPIDRTRDEVVRDLTAKAAEVSKIMTEFKTLAMNEMKAFIDLSLKEYGVSWGGKKGNVTLTSYNGAFMALIAVADHLAFDERLQAAKVLVDECLTEWTTGVRPEVKVLVDRAFQVDKQGKINTGRVLELRRVAFQDPKWKRAMEAISESVMVAESKEYIRFYCRNEKGGYDQINLDFAAA